MNHDFDSIPRAPWDDEGDMKQQPQSTYTAARALANEMRGQLDADPKVFAMALFELLGDVASTSPSFSVRVDPSNRHFRAIQRIVTGARFEIDKAIRAEAREQSCRESGTCVACCEAPSIDGGDICADCREVTA